MRIISGQFKGRTLLTPPEGTRPTADRAKEMLFDILSARLMQAQQQWSRLRFADVFAGSGAVGLEAYSRGCKHVFLFEKDKQAQRIIRQNARQMEITLYGEALVPPVAPKPMDILFMDAPYHLGLWESALTAFDKKGWIDDHTWVIVEVDSHENPSLPAPFVLKEKRHQGRNTFLFLTKESLNES